MEEASDTVNHGSKYGHIRLDEKTKAADKPMMKFATSATFLSVGTVLAFFAAAIWTAFGLRGTHNYVVGPQAVSHTHCYKNIRTLDKDQPTAQCFTVVNGVFAEVNGGRSDTKAAENDAELKRRDDGNEGNAADGYVIPGLWDGHGHLVDYGEMLVQVDLFGATTLEEVRARLKEYISKHPESGTKERWLRGIGWDQTNFGRMPTAVCW